MLAKYETSAAVFKALRTHEAKFTQSGWRPTWKTTSRRKSGLPAHQSLVTPSPPQGQDLRGNGMADMDWVVIICPCKMFLSRIEAIDDASGDFIEQM